MSLRTTTRKRYGLTNWARLLWKNLNHHGLGVVYTVPRIIGYVDMCADDSDAIQVTDAPKYSNVLWVEINGDTYSFKYDHDRRRIVVRHNPNARNQGPEVASFSDEQPLNVMDEFFLGLSGTKRAPRVARAARAAS